jgi:lipopolysaccharide heptosyltransferase II
VLAAEWKSIRRLLAVRLDNVGDIVLLGPSLRALRDALPEAAITLMVSPAGSKVTPMLPWIDDVIVHRAVWQDLSGAIPQDFDREMELIETLRARRFDAAVLFTSFSQSPYPPAHVCYLAGIPLRLGQSREFGGRILSHWVKPLPDEVHQAERNLHLLRSAGFPVGDSGLALNVPQTYRRQADDALRAAGVGPGAPFIALAPGASARARRYEPARFAAVARCLADETGLPIVVLGSEREHELAAPILAEGRRGEIVSLVGRTSVPEMAAVIDRAELLLGNDSGPMHIADALNRPMVILYSGTEHESQWQPRRAPARLLRVPTPCSPCYAFTCPYQMECLDIAPETVAAEALALLALSLQGSLAR